MTGVIVEGWPKAERQQFIAAHPGHPSVVLAEWLSVTTRTIERDRKELGLPRALRSQLPAYRKHGAHTGYQHGCRCDVCVEEWRAYMATQKESRLSRGLAPDDPRHGTENGYCNWDCRCTPCKAAWSGRNARQYARRKAAAGPEDD